MREIKPFNQPIYITRPILPPLKEVFDKIKEIWDSKMLTNMGIQHKTLESVLIKFLKVKYLTLFCNGTLALHLAIQALKLTGEVITTPFTFPATVNSLYQNKIKPIYCDIKLDNYTINSDFIEELITPKTSGILAVHVFGNPCEIDKIAKIAKNYNIKVLYDAAHAFSTEFKNRGIGEFGDISMFSFHATKIFHTIEGGALTYNDPELKDELYLLKNFGIKNEEEVILPGINAKMNELQAAIGLLNFKIFGKEIEKREKISKIYEENLKNIEGIKCLEKNKDVKHNYQYFPILIDEKEFKFNRNQVYEYMKKYNVLTRKYFYPLCTNYKHSIKEKKNYYIPNANRISNQILCLPIYGELLQVDIEKICNILVSIQK